eukprot:gene3600-3943_t
MSQADSFLLALLDENLEALSPHSSSEEDQSLKPHDAPSPLLLRIQEKRRRCDGSTSSSPVVSSLQADGRELTMVAAFSPEICLDDFGQEVDLSTRPKARIRRKVRSVFPRIVSNDLRRLLPAMMINVMNSADGHMIDAFFKTYCVPSCQMFRNLKDPLMTATLQNLRNRPWPLKGRDRIATAMRFICGLPDIIVKLEASCIQHTPRGPGSKVIIKMTIKNSMFDETFVEFVDKSGLRRASTKQGFEFLVRSKGADPSGYTQEYLLAPGYVERTWQDVMILHLDNLRQVYCIEVVGQLERTPKLGMTPQSFDYN